MTIKERKQEEVEQEEEEEEDDDDDDDERVRGKWKWLSQIWIREKGERKKRGWMTLFLRNLCGYPKHPSHNSQLTSQKKVK